MPSKSVRIRFVPEAKETYVNLKSLADSERQRGVTSSFHQTLLRSIQKKIDLLTANYLYGTQIPRAFIPRKYVDAYEATNLWKVDLSGYWRMVYTLKQPKTELATIDIVEIYLDVLDLLDHPAYDKTFGYKKK